MNTSSPDVPGDSNLTEHQIEVTSEEPILSKPYAVPYNVRVPKGGYPSNAADGRD